MAVSQFQRDSKRCWMACFGAASLTGLSMGVPYSFGVLYVSLLKEFGESRSKTAWIGSLHFIWYMMLSPLTSYLAHMYGYRRVALVGNLFFVLGIFFSTFAENLELFYFTYGILFATGTSIVLLSGITVVPHLFQKHLGTATGIMIGSTSFCSLWVAPLYEYLIRTFGWRHAGKLLCLVVVPLTIGCVLLPRKQQVPQETSQDETETKKPWVAVYSHVKGLLKSKKFSLWLIIIFVVYFALFIPYIHLFSFSEDIGIPTRISVYTISVMCICDSLGKVIVGKLQDRFRWDLHTIVICVLLVLAVSSSLLPLAKHVAHLFLYSVLYGVSMGVLSLLVLILTPKLCQREYAKHSVSFLYCIIGFPGAFGPVFAGWIYDMKKSYDLAFFISGGVFAFSALLAILLSSIAERTENKVQGTTRELMVLQMSERAAGMEAKKWILDDLEGDTV